MGMQIELDEEMTAAINRSLKERYAMKMQIDIEEKVAAAINRSLKEYYAAESCMRVAFEKFIEGDLELAIDRTEDALRSLKALQEIKKAN